MSEQLTHVLSLYRGLIPVDPPKPTMKEIAILVAERHGVTLEDLRGPSRRLRASRPRQEAMALIMAQKRYSYPQVGRFFNRDHTTVIHGERAYQKRLEAAKVAAE